MDAFHARKRLVAWLHHTAICMCLGWHEYIRVAFWKQNKHDNNMINSD